MVRFKGHEEVLGYVEGSKGITSKVCEGGVYLEEG